MYKTIFHVFNRNGYDRSLQNPPDYKLGEHVVAIKLTIPDSVFQRRHVPVVEVVLKAQDIGTYDVAIDGVAVAHPADEAAVKQACLQEEFAQLFEAARQSSDPTMREVAERALQNLLASGVEVRIASEPSEQEVSDDADLP